MMEGIMEDADRAEIVVKTLGWNSDGATRPGERSNAQLHSRVFINGVEAKWVSGITVDAKGGDFMEAHLHICPSSVTFEEMVTFDEPTDVYEVKEESGETIGAWFPDGTRELEKEGKA